jgi:hypothetical protein
VHEPHWAIPHPYLVPVNPSVSRRTHKSGVSLLTSTVCFLPFTVSVIDAIVEVLSREDRMMSIEIEVKLRKRASGEPDPASNVKKGIIKEKHWTAAGRVERMPLPFTARLATFPRASGWHIHEGGSVSLESSTGMHLLVG